MHTQNIWDTDVFSLVLLPDLLLAWPALPRGLVLCRSPHQSNLASNICYFHAKPENQLFLGWWSQLPPLLCHLSNMMVTIEYLSPSFRGKNMPNTHIFSLSSYSSSLSLSLSHTHTHTHTHTHFISACFTAAKYKVEDFLRALSLLYTSFLLMDNVHIKPLLIFTRKRNLSHLCLHSGLKFKFEENCKLQDTTDLSGFPW